MKKLVVGLSFAALLMSCQKVQEGKNKSVLRMDNVSSEGFPYNVDVQGVREQQIAPAHVPDSASAALTTDSAKTSEVKGTAIITESPSSGQADVK